MLALLTLTTDMSESRRIADQLRRAFEGEAWHGPAVLELLAALPAADAARHPIATAHSIWELVLHVTTWNQVVVRRLGGTAYEPPEHENWRTPPKPSDDDAWAGAVDALRASYRALHNALVQLDERRLDEQVPGKPYSVYVMVHGAVQHALYHGGQIALLERALAGQ